MIKKNSLSSKRKLSSLPVEIKPLALGLQSCISNLSVVTSSNYKAIGLTSLGHNFFSFQIKLTWEHIFMYKLTPSSDCFAYILLIAQ